MNKPMTGQAEEALTFREAILPPKLRELRQKLGQKAKQQKRSRITHLASHVPRHSSIHPGKSR